jgi:hypothetical protein
MVCPTYCFLTIAIDLFVGLRLMSIVTFVIRSFVLHVSITRPLGEGGKLQLTSDMMELEFALNAFLTDNSQSKKGANLESVGDDYHALRAMRCVTRLARGVTTKRHYPNTATSSS